MYNEEKPEQKSATENQQRNETLIDANNLLRTQQDLVYAIIGGVSAAVVGGLFWAVVTVATNYQIGYMAIAVGLLAGFAVRYFGSGIDTHFGFVGAFFALVGCALGNLLSQVAFIANAESLSYFDTLTLLNIDLVLSIYKESFSPMDLLFYGIAAYEGYKFAFRPVSEDTLNLAKKGVLETTPFAKFRLPIVCVLFIIIMIGGYVISRGSEGAKVFYYESGAKKSAGEMSAGLENGFWSYWWENGQIQHTGFFKNGLQDSLWHFYDEDGILYRKGSFLRDTQQGSWVDYYTDGKVSSEGNYSMGRQEGPWTFYFENAKISQKGFYHLDFPDSTWEYYYENGKLSSKGAYNLGQSIGFWGYWNEDGSKAQELEFDSDGVSKTLNKWTDKSIPEIANGNGIYKEYFDNGLLAETGNIKDGYRTDRWEKNYATGKSMEQGEYKKGEYYLTNSWSPTGKAMVINGVGLFESYYDSAGSVYETGQIINGLRSGLWKTNSVFSGNVSVETNYSDGQPNGLYKSYYEDGSINSEGSFKAGKREGEWMWYFTNGSVETSVSFKNGKKEGVQPFYNDKDVLLRTELYENGKLLKAQF